MALNAVVFDFDGTLTKAGAIDFPMIRKETGCPADQYLLDYFKTLPEEQRIPAEELLVKHELNAACVSQEEDYTHDLIIYLEHMEIPIFIITRNSRKSVIRALENFKHTTPAHFRKIISRDDPFPVKPDPASIQHIGKILNVHCSEILVVGDYIHDIEAGRNAGSKTVYKQTGRENDDKVLADFSIKNLNELIPVIKILNGSK